MLTTAASQKSESSEFLERFPDVDYDFEPFGNRVFVQIRKPPRLAGSIHLSEETYQHAYYEEQVAVVRKLGESCFTFMTNGEMWPCGVRFKVGDFVRVPRHGGDNHWEGDTLFKIFKDYEIIGKHDRPLAVKTVYSVF